VSGNWALVTRSHLLTFDDDHYVDDWLRGHKIALNLIPSCVRVASDHFEGTLPSLLVFLHSSSIPVIKTSQLSAASSPPSPGTCRRSNDGAVSVVGIIIPEVTKAIPGIAKFDIQPAASESKMH